MANTKMDDLDLELEEQLNSVNTERADFRPSQFNPVYVQESKARPLSDLFAIPLDDLIPFQQKGDSDFSPLSEEEIDEMAKNMDKDGSYEPIIVRELENMKFEILSGEHRTKAARKKGLKEIKAIVMRACSDEKAMEVFLLTNLQRRKTKISDMIYGWSLYAKTHPSLNIRTTLSEEMNITVTQYYRYVRMGNLLDCWIKALDEGKMSIRVGYAIAAYNKEEQKLFLPYAKKLTDQTMSAINKAYKENNKTLTTELIQSIIDPGKAEREYDSSMRSAMKNIRSEIEKSINPQYHKEVGTIMLQALNDFLNTHPEYKA